MKNRNTVRRVFLVARILLAVALAGCSVNRPANDPVNRPKDIQAGLEQARQEPAATETRIKSVSNDQIIGVKIYDYEGSLEELFDKWRDLGVNTVFASDALSLNGDFRRIARERGVKIFTILPIFQNPEALKQDPGLHAITHKGKKAVEDWVEFVCPTRRDYREEKIKYIENLIT